MKSLATLLRTISYGVVFCFVVVVGIVPALIIALLPERLRFKFLPLYWLEHAAFWLIIKSLWVKVAYKGMDNIPYNGSLIFVANHQSSLDIPLLGILARGRAHVWLFISWLTKYPIFGFIIRRLEVIVDPSSPRKAVESISNVVKRVKATNHHVMIFPEGGRYAKIRDFFTGFAIIAEQTGSAVVPVYFKNNHKVCKPRTVWINNVPLYITVGKPFIYKKREDKHEFTKRVRTWFLQQQDSKG